MPSATSSPDARRERARLGHPPRSAEALRRPVGALVGDQQLDQGLALVVEDASDRPGRERAELLAELGLEYPVDHLEDLRAGAEVGVERRARADRRQPLAALLEQLDVGVAEAVDRLLRVADREQVPAAISSISSSCTWLVSWSSSTMIRSNRAVALAQRRVGPQQLAALELEVLEVEPRDLALARA